MGVVSLAQDVHDVDVFALVAWLVGCLCSYMPLAVCQPSFAGWTNDRQEMEQCKLNMQNPGCVSC